MKCQALSTTWLLHVFKESSLLYSTSNHCFIFYTLFISHINGSLLPLKNLISWTSGSGRQATKNGFWLGEQALVGEAGHVQSAQSLHVLSFSNMGSSPLWFLLLTLLFCCYTLFLCKLSSISLYSLLCRCLTRDDANCYVVGDHQKI